MLKSQIKVGDLLVFDENKVILLVVRKFEELDENRREKSHAIVLWKKETFQPLRKIGSEWWLPFNGSLEENKNYSKFA